jgi:hypothetical protein
VTGLATLPAWTDDELERQRREAIAVFIEERMAEGSASYRAYFAANVDLIEQLFADTDDLLAFAGGAALAARPPLLQVARYLAAPAISGDDLDTLAGRAISDRRHLDLELSRLAAEVILAAVDPERFPWLVGTRPRPPSMEERSLAIRWTAGLRAAQQAQMGRRSESADRQEAAVRILLGAHGFEEVARRPITVGGGLEPGEFCRETRVVGRKCDVPARLRDRRFLLVECKVSNSSVNSVKRLNNDVLVKAGVWRQAFGQTAITAAVLAGVYKLTNLRDAQEGGVAIFWEHDLGPLAEFLDQTSA